ncbi:MAG: type III PLP-dependent enzyme [Nitrospirae bacterium]|nr:type III PLP-dependent enzyme [Candidatus Manganitrophaceae bacterium]
MDQIDTHTDFRTAYDWENLVKTHGAPLLLLDCNTLRSQYKKLTSALPKVTIYFAVKSLPNEIVLETLKQEGSHFDIATQGEIKLLEQLSIPPQRTIHTHPIKRDIDIRASMRYGCTTFVVDNLTELEKFRPYRERVGLLLRIAFSNGDAVVNLSKKFGLCIEDAPNFIIKAKKLGIRIKGLSFHVGSQSKEPDAHVAAITSCATLLEKSRAGHDAPMSVLDIGGGFPIDYDGTAMNIDRFCIPIRTALQTLPKNVQVIAEPGRFIAAPAMTCVASVIGISKRNEQNWYYLDDGVYGSFSGQVFDHAKYPIFSLNEGQAHASVLAGPTCDSIDIISTDIPLPKLNLGDLIIAPMMGAYTSATATEFNFVPKTQIVPINGPELPTIGMSRMA